MEQPKKELTLNDVIRYADFDSRSPETWKKREEEAQRHNEHLLKLFPKVKGTAEGA